jgi:hypothetical protein
LLKLGKRIDAFTYEDLAQTRIKYVHDEFELANSIYERPKPEVRDDWVDLKVSDGKNDATTNLKISIARNDNEIPVLKSTFKMRIKELERRKISPSELRVVDKDTPDDKLKIIITHPPQYGTLEKQIGASAAESVESKSGSEDKVISINTNTNQKLNFILKFNNPNAKQSVPSNNYITVNEFTMADIAQGLISYKHRSPGARQDRFGFIVYDGFNNMFMLDTNGLAVSNYQIFNLAVEMDKNESPVIEKNIGLDYLYQIDGNPGRLIMKNELLVVDKDDTDEDIVLEITRKPAFGFVEHKDRPGVPLHRFSQAEINANKIYYILRSVDDKFEDYFEFDVYDSVENVLRQNRFNVKWSFVQFEETELSVMESEGKARVHIKKSGYLKQFSMVSCKTISNTAKSNRDGKLYDFIYTHVRVEFSEDESYKACDVILNKDEQTEPIESFYVQLEEAKYSIIGKNNRIKVNILDKK